MRSRIRHFEKPVPHHVSDGERLGLLEVFDGVVYDEIVCRSTCTRSAASDEAQLPTGFCHHVIFCLAALQESYAGKDLRILRLLHDVSDIVTELSGEVVVV